MSVLQTVMGIVDTGRISVPTVLESMVKPVKPEVAEARLDWWSDKLVRDARIDLVVKDRENAGDGSEPMVVMSNHQSLYDIPVLFRAVPGRIRMVAKAELFRVPVWGRAMLAAGFVKIDRADREKAIEALRSTGAALLSSGTRVWIAPEGTRSRDGRLGTFKSGGFRMALDMKVRILPVAIEGTRKVLPAKGFVVQQDQEVRVTILPPVDPMAYGVERRKELMDDVRSVIAQALGQDEGDRSSAAAQQGA